MPVKANDHNKSCAKKVSMPTLIYPGCGYDEELLSLQLPYDRIIAYDTLPRCPHYRPGQLGWTHTATPDLFFAKLRHEYGEFVEVSDTELHFPRHNIAYHHSTNCSHVEVPEGDIFVRGYFCESWIPVMRQRRVIVSCDTYLGDLYDNDIAFELVHTCKGVSRCSLEDDETTGTREEYQRLNQKYVNERKGITADLDID